MVTLVFSMLRARLGQAVTVFLLAAAAVAAATSGPVYVATADRAVVASEVAGARPAERTIEARRAYSVGDEPGFERNVPGALSLPGFTAIFGVEYLISVEAAGGRGIPNLVYRDDVCRHLTIVSGRCFSAATEVVIGEATAKLLDVGVGSAVFAQRVELTSEGYQAVSGGLPLTVVGLYRPTRPGAAYWASHGYFEPTGDGALAEPIFGNRGTLEIVPHVQQIQTVDSIAGPDAITADTLDAVDRGVVEAGRDVASAQGTTVTELPALLERVRRNRSLVATIVPVGAIPLVLLCWFVLFLVVAAGAQQRRHELGLLVLRGTRAPTRWWLAIAESALPILFGAVAGYLLGHLAVRVAATVMLSDTAPVPLSTGLSRYVVLTVAGALVAGVLAMRRQVSQPAAELLRDVRPRRSYWRTAAGEAVVVVLAVVAVVQLQTSGGGLSGLGLLAPAMLVLSVGVLAARAVVPLADRIGARALRRGRLGPALAAYGLSRRPGGQRLLTLVVVAVGLVCFAGAAGDVAQRAREERLTVELGAPRVVTVEQVNRQALLAAVRSIDPDGRFAMAVVSMAQGSTDQPVKLGVDATRLAAVAAWGDAGIGAAEAAKRLRPAVAEPVHLRGTELTIDATGTLVDEAYRARLVANVVSLDGRASQRLDLGPLRPGRHTYAVPVADCRDGCRLATIEAAQPERRGFPLDLTVHEVRVDDAVLLDRAALGDSSKWRAPVVTDERISVGRLSGEEGGLRMRLPLESGNESLVRAHWADSPQTLPMLAATEESRRPESVSGLDGRDYPAGVVGEVPVLPRLGVRGVLVDFEYAERAAVDFGTTDLGEVWLGPAAPADAVDRLRAAGLRITGERSFTGLRTALAEQGPSVALRFHLLAGGFAVLLVLGALEFLGGVDRRQRSVELRHLRQQGVSRGAVTAAGVRANLLIVAAGLVIGAIAGLACWLVTGDWIPLFADDVRLVPRPVWPGPVGVVLPWVVAAVALVAVAVSGGVRLRNSVERDGS